MHRCTSRLTLPSTEGFDRDCLLAVSQKGQTNNGPTAISSKEFTLNDFDRLVFNKAPPVALHKPDIIDIIAIGADHGYHPFKMIC